jgi:hypothetical protein
LNTKDIALVVLVILTVVFASLTASEYYRVSNLGSEPSTTVTTTTTVICPLDSVCPPFTCAPSSPLRIDLVQASNKTVNGESHVGFDVEFHNIGDAPIYIPAGSTGISVSVPTDSPVLVTYPSPRCAGVFMVFELDPGQSYSLGGPSCETGVSYALAQAGSVNVAFSFNWTTNAGASTYPNDFPNSTTISTQFVFP